MKTPHKLLLATCLVATLSACTTQTLEQQIAVKEPNSWDFRIDKKAGGTEYIRIYDGPGKVGWFKYEYGQKSPCNMGFQKTIKHAIPGLVEYVLDDNAKSYACYSKIRYVFRTDAQGHPYEGWVSELADKDKTKFADLSANVKFWEATGAKPKYFLVKE